ncbi:MAG: hypothetical protein ACM3KH_00495 [Thiobacillus sp.]
MSQKNINKKVTVTSIGFKKNLAAYPRRIEFQGRTYNFIDAGLRCLVSHGEKIAEIFTLSDGRSNFSLRRDNQDGTWTLISIAS